MCPHQQTNVQPPLSRRGKKLVFVVTEDWFFASHFLPMARAATEVGLETVVVTRVRDHSSDIEQTGSRVIPFEAERRSLNPLAAGYAVCRLAAILRAEKPDIVHCIALRSILIGGAAALLAGISRRVYALTGLGLLGARSDALARGARLTLRALIRGPLHTGQTQLLFENPDDPGLLGLDPSHECVTIVGGAGVDTDSLTASPVVPQPPLKVAVVARMLWSKGIDIAVEATRIARARGAALELSLYGAPDPSNPKCIPERMLQQWNVEPGIVWHGATKNVVSVWRTHHVCCLPSRGGEGLPRTLLEAAACGRAIVTSDVPGCRAFVRDGLEGRVVPPNDPARLADAFTDLAKDPSLVSRMGEAARARVLVGFTEKAVTECVRRLYTRMLVEQS
jgi:glycosyltransferase involved in cell wall biosynthesis